MNINRHNYEEFFLLYVDNELSATGRKAVDEFVLANPDLKIELQALQQTVVKADDIVLEKKNWLFKEVDITALQENLLLYADDELTADEKQSVEVLLATDITAQSEWSILQQTKIKPDMAVVFADKHLLYRKEAGRIVGFTWWRVAAAAVLLGIITWVGISMYKNNLITPAVDGGLVDNNKVKTILPQKETTTNTVAVKNAEQEKKEQQNIITTDAANNLAIQKVDIKKDVLPTALNKNKTSEKENIVTQSNKKIQSDNNLPKPNFENINNNASNEIIATNVKPENNNSSRVSGNNATVVRSITEENIAGSIDNHLNKTNTAPAIIAVSNKTNTNEATGNSYLNVDNEKGKRTSLGGFLRKAKRIIERTTNVNTGDGIKVAGFEIALK